MTYSTFKQETTDNTTKITIIIIIFLKSLVKRSLAKYNKNGNHDVLYSWMDSNNTRVNTHKVIN